MSTDAHDLVDRSVFDGVRLTSGSATCRRRAEIGAGHHAYSLDEQSFDALIARLHRSAAPFGSGHAQGWDRQVDSADGQPRVHVLDADGHSYEFFTRHGGLTSYAEVRQGLRDDSGG